MKHELFPEPRAGMLNQAIRFMAWFVSLSRGEVFLQILVRCQLLVVQDFSKKSTPVATFQRSGKQETTDNEQTDIISTDY